MPTGNREGAGLTSRRHVHEVAPPRAYRRRLTNGDDDKGMVVDDGSRLLTATVKTGAKPDGTHATNKLLVRTGGYDPDTRFRHLPYGRMIRTRVAGPTRVSGSVGALVVDAH